MPKPDLSTLLSKGNTKSLPVTACYGIITPSAAHCYTYLTIIIIIIIINVSTLSHKCTVHVKCQYLLFVPHLAGLFDRGDRDGE